MRTSECINQPALNEARLVIVDESFDLNRDGGHGFKQPNVPNNRRLQRAARKPSG